MEHFTSTPAVYRANKHTTSRNVYSLPKMCPHMRIPINHLAIVHFLIRHRPATPNSTPCTHSLKALFSGTTMSKPPIPSLPRAEHVACNAH
jgi:hypothetical protein